MSQGSRGITTLQNKFPFLFLVSHRPCTVQVVSQSSCPPLNQPQTMLKICCTGKRKKKSCLKVLCLFVYSLFCCCFVVQGGGLSFAFPITNDNYKTSFELITQFPKPAFNFMVRQIIFAVTKCSESIKDCENKFSISIFFTINYIL